MKKNKEKDLELSVGDLARLKAIFDRKNWPIEDAFGENRFENFCDLLGERNPTDRELILKLTENFLWVREQEYLKHFANAFGTFVEKFDFKGSQNIIITPMLPEEDFGKSKSSIVLFYSIKASIQSLQAKYPNYNICLVDVPQKIQCNRISQNSILCLVDDYIGSGETADAAASYFLKQSFPREKITLMSLVAMEEGMKHLKATGYNTYTSIVQAKGITGTGRNEDEEKALMSSIETSIGVTEDYRLGYASSEALVSMIRTPNNTFPIYWFRNKKEKLNLHAPFPR